MPNMICNGNTLLSYYFKYIENCVEVRFYKCTQKLFLVFENRYKIAKNRPISMRTIISKSQEFAVFKKHNFLKNLGNDCAGNNPRNFSGPPCLCRRHLKKTDFNNDFAQQTINVPNNIFFSILTFDIRL